MHRPSLVHGNVNRSLVYARLLDQYNSSGRQHRLQTLNAARLVYPRFARCSTQADDATAWDSALLLASPAAALLACCTWSGSSNRDYVRRGDGDNGYPDWLGRAPVLADAAVPAANRTVTVNGGRPEEAAAAWAGKAKARAEAALRAARLVWTAVVISADYKAFDVSQVSF